MNRFSCHFRIHGYEKNELSMVVLVAVFGINGMGNKGASGGYKVLLCHNSSSLCEKKVL